MIFYFSGTGNSRWVARQLAQSLCDSLVSIAASYREGRFNYELSADERVGFVFPVYSWGPPPLVLSFIEQLSLSHASSRSYLYFVCTCGDDTGKTRQVFEQAVHRKGWECQAGFSVTMPNTYVLLPGFDVDAPEVTLRKLKEASVRIDEISAVLGRQEHVFSCHEGLFPRFKTHLIRPLFNRYHMTPQKFTVTESCVGCGACVKACPMQNISLIHERPTWGQDCASCLACYHICRHQAIQYGSRTRGKGQYYHR